MVESKAEKELSKNKDVDVAMMEFTITIANRVFGVQAMFPSTRDYCRDYLTEAESERMITLNAADLDFEREKSIREDQIEGIVPDVACPDPGGLLLLVFVPEGIHHQRGREDHAALAILGRFRKYNIHQVVEAWPADA